jgi:hypothetical protein
MLADLKAHGCGPGRADLGFVFVGQVDAVAEFLELLDHVGCPAVVRPSSTASCDPARCDVLLLFVGPGSQEGEAGWVGCGEDQTRPFCFGESTSKGEADAGSTGRGRPPPKQLAGVSQDRRPFIGDVNRQRLVSRTDGDRDRASSVPNCIVDENVEDLRDGNGRDARPWEIPVDGHPKRSAGLSQRAVPSGPKVADQRVDIEDFADARLVSGEGEQIGHGGIESTRRIERLGERAT